MNESLLEEAAAAIAVDAAGMYRIQEARAMEIARDVLRKSPAFAAAAEKSAHLDDLRRMRAFTEAARETRRRIYANLRRYREENAEAGRLSPEAVREAVARGDLLPIFDAHISAQERIFSLPELWDAFEEHLSDVETLLDVGCGVHPLMLPMTLSALKKVVALDRDAAAIGALQAAAETGLYGKMEATVWNISEGWDRALALNDGQPYDAALMMKLIPVIERQERDLLPVLAEVPARLLIVTGAKQSMTKRRSIARRERGILRSFAEAYGFTVGAEFETPDETGLVLRRRG